MTNNINDSDREQGKLSEPTSEELFETIGRYDTELKQIKKIIINRNIQKIYSDSYLTILKASIPAFILLLLSFFVGVESAPFLGNIFESISKYINPEQQVLNTDIQPVTLWWFPFVIFLIFVFCAIRANMALKKEFIEREASEDSITRIIDRYSGIVDGLGTALPLLGAAVLLISIEKGPAVFLGFAVPFEIKSILILAIAKLFDSVFDALALKYQEIQEGIKNMERAYQYSQQNKSIEIKNNNIIQPIPPPIIIESSVTKEQVDRIYETMKASHELGLNIKLLIAEINNLKLPEERVLRELQKTSVSLGESIKFLGTTLDSFKDTNVNKSLANLVTLLGKKEA
ncbi:MAG: hypothetical protein M3R36_08505 [Bacteroidota bacterium]|nr:hypothetical protein [Bacteroidota bacterium]